jgi:branched-chain amino acid transport system ATP-binding protein
MELAPVLVREVFKAIESLRKSGMTILISEQFARSALAVSDRAYVIERGAVVLEGTSIELSRNPAVLSAYLG